jgi:type IV pilus assembly protein PilC
MTVVFAYTARSAEGRFVAGSFAATSREAALAHLRARALFVTSIAREGSPSGAIGTLLAGTPISERARVGFVRSFATLIGAGVPIRRALEVVVANCHAPRLQEALHGVAGDVESGSALSSALARRPREFSPLFVAMVRAGELGGTLDTVLERLAALLERHAATRKRLQSALTYPLIVTLAAIGLILFLVSSTVPAFAALFAQMHVSLPWSTRLLITAGVALRSPFTWAGLIAGTAVLAILVHGGRRIERVALRLDTLALAVPLIGPVVRKAAVARFARTLGTLLRSGVSLLPALDAARDVAGNAVYAAALGELASALREGIAIADALDRTGLFDALFLQLVRVGEETGALDATLLRIAEYYELDVETALATLASVVEPVLILALGGVVGFIVASILIPLYATIGRIA